MVYWSLGGKLREDRRRVWKKGVGNHDAMLSLDGGQVFMLGSSTDVLLVLTRSDSDVRVCNTLSLESGANLYVLSNLGLISTEKSKKKAT